MQYSLQKVLSQELIFNFSVREYNKQFLLMQPRCKSFLISKYLTETDYNKYA